MTVLTSRRPRGLGIRVRGASRFGAARALGLGIALGPLLILGLGCSGDHLTRTQPVAPDSLFWALDLNHHAVTLSLQAPYDTLTLAVTARTFDGTPLGELGTPQYRSLDLDRVQVTDGVLHAIDLTTAGQPVPVVATLRSGRQTLTDTVLVRVVADTLPKLASLSIHPIPPDSAKTAATEGGFFGSPIVTRVTDSSGASIPDALVAIRSSNPATAAVTPFFGSTVLAGEHLGTVTVVASATIFGVARADTLPYQVGWPVAAIIQTERHSATTGDSVTSFGSPEVRVGVGALVIWVEQAMSDTVDVTFTEQDIASIVPSDSSHPVFSIRAQLLGISPSLLRSLICAGGPNDCDTGGNILLTPERPGALRMFTTPGTYEYHSARFGASGRIIVVGE